MGSAFDRFKERFRGSFRGSFRGVKTALVPTLLAAPAPVSRRLFTRDMPFFE